MGKTVQVGDLKLRSFRNLPETTLEEEIASKLDNEHTEETASIEDPQKTMQKTRTAACPI